jgi:hypothetical protein
MDMAEEWVSELEMLAILAGSRRVSRHWWSLEDAAAVNEAVRLTDGDVGVWSVDLDSSGWQDGEGRWPVLVDATDDGRAWLVGVIAAARQGSTARDGTAHSS